MVWRSGRASQVAGHRTLVLAATIVMVGAGCQSGVTARRGNHLDVGRDSSASNEPLTFKRHNFGAFCYSTYGCHVTYNGFTHVSEPDDVLQPSSTSLGEKYPANLDASYLSIGNFPEPASVAWKSKDGVEHSAFVDIASIFWDRYVLHHVPKRDVGGDIGDPGIILEVNDRTINVYMKVFVPTREPQVPGNKHSYFRDDLILAWSKVY